MSLVASIAGALGLQEVGPEMTEDDLSASEAELKAWVEEVTGRRIGRWTQIAGGNRCRSWAIELVDPPGRSVYLRYQPPRPPSAEPYTVWREARIYQALKGTDVLAPALQAIHPTHQAIVTELAPGRADYRSLTDPSERETVAREFVQAIARLHATKFPPTAIPGLAESMSIADCVRAELQAWLAMYAETLTPDPLIDLAMRWLSDNVPNPADPPVLVHGDAGPGNFLFDAGHLTALVDWELAHAGDPMEDLAWYSMRNVMEPTPDFAERLRDYEAASGAKIDLARVRYHRVFVSARVVIIRHRNVTGLAGNSIVSRALNRRLLVDALAEATGVALAPPESLQAGPTPRTELYDGVLDALRDEIAGPATDSRIKSSAKDNAKVVKYLREADRLGDLVAESERANLSAVLGGPVTSLDEGRARLLDAVNSRVIPFDAALRFFAVQVAREAQVAALSSGGLAHRRLPALDGLGDRQ